ncbi:fasciclin domain-containing protein [Cyanothece sp. BG0011]|uniref:fasciclin domain-containing protein n=1 Tax=Cyanothece sp. BG0011 TaxID=2082950 RepID=UPI000D1EC95A|nr:fasciclin domain-containing protein [Cyanothece sp. BG0011]
MNSLKEKLTVFTSLLGMSTLLITPAAMANTHTSDSMRENTSTQMTNQDYQSQMENNLVGVATNSNQFNTLVKAIEAAGLKDTLAQGGPYTIFAPTDEAFNELPDGALNYLLQPENQDVLKEVLTYHVVSTEVTASELSTGTVNTLGGGVSVLTHSEQVIVNNASVVNPNIEADNGVIHAINRVLMPRELRERLVSKLQAQQ